MENSQGKRYVQKSDKDRARMISQVLKSARQIDCKGSTSLQFICLATLGSEWFVLIVTIYTRLHSSRMRIARLLPVFLRMDCAEGGGSACLWSRGVCSTGYAPRGVSTSGPGGRGVPASGPGGCIPACNGADVPVDRILDTRFWKYYLAPNFLCRW